MEGSSRARWRAARALPARLKARVTQRTRQRTQDERRGAAKEAPPQRSDEDTKRSFCPSRVSAALSLAAIPCECVLLRLLAVNGC